MVKNSSKMILEQIFPVEKVENFFLLAYQAKKFGNQSLFESILFEIDRIVCDRLNIAIT
jgi:hypothetical protein